MSLTDEAITRTRALIQSGTLPPGSRLPPEQQLAAELGISRSPMREAVKAGPADRTLAEHEAIYTALAERDADLAHATALTHITTTERWLRRVHGAGHATTGGPPPD